MFTIIHHILPIILLACGLGLMRKEWIVFRNSYPRPWILLVRRFLGALALMTIAVMLHFGDTTLILMDKSQAADFARANREYATACLHYWFAMMGVVLATVCLAVWDAIDVLRRLRSFVDASANEDMQAFRRILEKNQASFTEAKGKNKVNLAPEQPDNAANSGTTDQPEATAPDCPAEKP